MLSGFYNFRHQVFRFYKDGTFLDSLIYLEPHEKLTTADNLAEWLIRDTKIEGMFQGTYEVIGKRIRFKTKPHWGEGKQTVDFSGLIDKDTILFTSVDNNTRRWERNMPFVKLPMSRKRKK
ncbi:hypothetical protein QNI16_32515 [Cytophagaceae bacterium YF14B1]|uniref:Uncharacterized protein n=1 Tax=Xanthocytophaga flava TaxID=3048013 RepID=A0AAE3QY05_9BACT|nr:hypothetical protein [Xanthocytophaga flavus]MDJ1485260.1 hypothetical protein [Xanthocytophaga flavus]